MLKARAALPIAGLKVEILQLLKKNNVLVVCGETGSGKTTQVLFPFSWIAVVQTVSCYFSWFSKSINSFIA